MLLYLGLGLLAIGIPLVYGFLQYRDGYNNHGELAAVTWSRPWFLLAGFAMICCLLLVVHRLRLAGRSIAVHQKGLYLVVGQVFVLRWEEISGIATAMLQPSLFGMRRSVRYRATIFPNLGKPISINGIVRELAGMYYAPQSQVLPAFDIRAQTDIYGWKVDLLWTGCHPARFNTIV